MPTQAPERLIGQQTTIDWESALPNDNRGTFKFKGVITHLSLQTDADLVNYYHISGYGLTYLLEDGVQQRTFVKQPLQTIFQQVLGAYPGDALPYLYASLFGKPVVSRD